MTSQRKEVFAWSRLVSDRSKHWQKALTNRCVIFYFYFYKETKKTKIYRYGFDCLFKNDKEHDQST